LVFTAGLVIIIIIIISIIIIIIIIIITIIIYYIKTAVIDNIQHNVNIMQSKYSKVQFTNNINSVKFQFFT